MSSTTSTFYNRSLIESLDDTQRAAVLSNKAMVVCAGAGSGKTRVLVAKYLYYAIELNIPLQSIVALTFTKKAANEMYERIYFVLTQVATEYSHIANQLQSFDGSAITTIDSYCHGLASEHYSYFNIEQIPTIDRGRYIALAQHIAYKTVLKHAMHHAIQQLVYTKGMHALLHDSLVWLALKYISFVHPINPHGSLAQIHQMLSESITASVNSILRDVELLQPHGSTVKALNTLAFFQPDRLMQLSVTSAPEECAEVVSPLLALTARFGKAQHIFHLKPLVKQIKKCAQRLCDITHYCASASDHQCVLNMLLDFQIALNRAKSRSGLFMYQDFLELSIEILHTSQVLPHFQCHALLVDEFQDVNALQKKLIYLIANRSAQIVEHSQPNHSTPLHSTIDTQNDDQAVVLKIPSHYPLCIVGDERQSIYGFRGAEYDVFRVAKQDICAIGGTIHFLAYNYRTHSELFRLVSLLEQQVLAKHQYTDSTEPLSSAAHNTAHINLPATIPFCSMYIISTDDAEDYQPMEIDTADTQTIDLPSNSTPINTFPEARYITSIIQQKMESETFRIYDGRVVRRARYSDFAILLRTRTRLQLFEKEMRAHNIPYSTISSPSPSHQLFLHDYFNLLQCIINPNDYACFLALLKSPWIRFDDAAVLQVHATLIDLTQTSSIPNASLQNYSMQTDSPPTHPQKTAGKTARSPYTTSNYLRALASVDEHAARWFDLVIQKITCYTSLQLIDWLWFDMGYRQQLLHSESDEYIEYVYRTLYHHAVHCHYPHQLLYFLRSQINRQPHQSSTESIYDIPRLQTEMHDGVILSTIHAAKGLEYPVVIIADMNATMRHETSRIIWPFDSNMYSVQYPTTNVPFELTKEKRKVQMENELLRLLYVAMTRAQSHLVLCGTVSSSLKAHSLLSLFEPLDKLPDISIHSLSASSISENCGTVTPLDTATPPRRQPTAPTVPTHPHYHRTLTATSQQATPHQRTNQFTLSFDATTTNLNAWYNHYVVESAPERTDKRATEDADQQTAKGTDERAATHNQDAQQHATTTLAATSATIYHQNHIPTIEHQMHPIINNNRIVHTNLTSPTNSEALPSLPIDEVLAKQNLHNAFGNTMHTCFFRHISSLPSQSKTPHQIVDACIDSQSTFMPSTHQALKQSLLQLLNTFVHSALYRQQIQSVQLARDVDAPARRSSRHTQASSHTAHHFHSFPLPSNQSVVRTIHHEHPFIFAIHQNAAHLTVTGTIDYLHCDDRINRHRSSDINAANSPLSLPPTPLHSPLLLDYKSDATLKPDTYRMQIACYQLAVHAMYGAYPRTYLYYVRSGDAIEMPIQHHLFSLLQRQDTLTQLYAYLVQ